jgi:tetratricopeptide (TPR) repeat protein
VTSFLESLRPYWPRILVALLLLILFSPSPVPRPLVSPIRAANIALNGGRPDSALVRLEEAVSFEPAAAGLHLAMAEVALAGGNPQAAKSYLASVDIENQSSMAYLCLHSRILLATGNTTEAVEIQESLMEACPQKESFLEDLSRAYLQAGDLKASLAALEESAAIKPTDPNVRLSLAILTATLQPEEALPHLRLVLESNASDKPLASALIRAIEDARLVGQPAFSLAQVGQTLARHDEWTYAAWAFLNAVALEPAYVEALAYLGLALDRSGQNGLHELKAAVEAAPTAALPRIFLALHWQSLGQLKLAQRELEIAADLDPSNPGVAAELGNAYAAMGDPLAAEASYRLATELAPEEMVFWLLLAQFSIANEIKVQAVGLPAARNAVVLNPEDPAAIDALGYAHLLLGDIHMAERLIWRAVNIQPNRAASQLHLGLLRQFQGDPIRARAAFRSAILIDPEGPAGQLAERFLSRSYP